MLVHFPQDADSPIWILERLIHHVTAPQAPGSSIASTTKNEGASSTSVYPTGMESVAEPETTGIRESR